MKLLSLLAVVVLAVSVSVVSGLEVAGKVETVGADWVFLQSFCFDDAGLGSMAWTIDFPGLIPYNATKYELLIYDDEQSSFPSIWTQKDKLSCAELVAKRKNKQHLYVQAGVTKEELFKDTNAGHQWFVAVAACGIPTQSLNFEYNITFKNADSKVSAELGAINAPTVFYAIFWFIGTLAFGLVVFRTHRLGLGLLTPMVHRYVAASVFFIMISNFCAWAWAADHSVPSLTAMLFFQGISQWLIMWVAGFLAVANTPLNFVGKICSYVYFGQAPLYFLFYFLMGTITNGEPFPGVVGSAVFANGLSIVASILRFIGAIAWVGLLFTSYRESRANSDKMAVLQTFVFGFSIALWLVILPIAIWANYNAIYSCNPASLIAGYAVATIFDGCILILMIIALDPAIVEGIFGDVLGSASILDGIMFWKWNSLDFSTTSSGAFQTGYSTLATGGDGEFGDSSSKATGGQASYQTL